MTTRTTSLRRLAALVVVLTAGLIAILLASPSTAVIINDKPLPLGLVGLREGETLRISVANVVGFDPQPDPPGCRLEIGFVDAENTAIGNPHILELRPGLRASFDHVAVGNPHIRHYGPPVGRRPRSESRVSGGRERLHPRPRGSRRDHHLRLRFAPRAMGGEVAKSMHKLRILVVTASIAAAFGAANAQATDERRRPSSSRRRRATCGRPSIRQHNRCAVCPGARRVQRLVPPE